MPAKLPSRDQIDKRYKWQLEDIFRADEDWENTFLSVQNDFKTLTDSKESVTASASQLLGFIRQMHSTEETLGKLYAYAHMKHDQDTSLAAYQEMYDRVNGLLVKFNQAVSFFEPELLNLPELQFNNFMEHETKLQDYAHFFNNIFRKRAHLLSAKEERLLALSGEVVQGAAEVFGVWDSADIVFPQMKDENGKSITISNGLYGKYQQSSNRRLRKDSYMGLYKPFIEHRNMLAVNYASIIKSHIFQTKARNYASSLEGALDENHIPVSVYHKLIESTHSHLQPLQRYNHLRKRLLHLNDGVHDYDLRAPLFTNEQKSYSWEEAQKLCLKGVEPLGPDYIELIRQSFNKGWIDVYENKGKRTGAYSSGTYGVHPYVLMNYNGTLGDVFTLTHELGHALHTWHTINHQPFVYGDYPIFLAEVASTANEALLQQYLIDTAKNKNEKLAYLNSYLDKFSQTFYRQVLFAEFEWRTHQMVEQGEALSADKLDTLFGELYQTYHGPDFTVDRETQALWSRVPHFYYNYYVFQYSTSFVASAALVTQLLNEGEAARKRYLNFLQSGNSQYAIETLKRAGIDMATETPVILTLNYMDSLLDQLEKLL